ncbi:MAG: IS110 family transposase [FCB group bacterium]|nr:IS110 family transposase [FCB group bacterium]MBL7121847.1 IS110 family transposase [Candidatus Neomarinimicrobiota bacterium]
MKRYEFSCGIDISAEDFTLTVSKTPGVALLGPSVFGNNLEGFESLDTWFKEQNLPPKELLICMEATGVYGEALCYYLHNLGYSVAVEAPLKVKRAFHPDGHKTDAVDSLQIAEYAIRFSDELKQWKPREEVVEQIKSLLSTREQLVKQRSASKNVLKGLERKVISSKIAMRSLHKVIKNLDTEISNLEKEIEKLIKSQPPLQQTISNLKSTPGTAMLLAAHLLSITNGFTQTMTARQMASYLKICSFKHESGSSVYKSPRSKKYGPSAMRKLLHLAARSVVTHDQNFRKYYLRKLEEGKPKKVILNNVANKLLKVLCAIIRDQAPYIDNYKSINPTLLNNA